MYIISNVGFKLVCQTRPAKGFKKLIFISSNNNNNNNSFSSLFVELLVREIDFNQIETFSSVKSLLYVLLDELPFFVCESIYLLCEFRSIKSGQECDPDDM
jgi:hypothetical protein